MKLFKNVLSMVVAVALVWVFFSFCDVVGQNTRPYPRYNEYNFFTLVSKSDQRLERATVWEVVGDEVTVLVSDGNLYAFYVDDPESFYPGMPCETVFKGTMIVDVIY